MNKQKRTGSSRAAIHQSGGFGSSLGFVLACMGSAAGMGNIWTSPYRVGQYGGGMFLVLHILLVVLFGLIGLSAKFVIGRWVRTGTLGAYEYYWEKIGKGRLGYFLAWIPLLGSLGIVIGYAIIVGWVIRILIGSVTGVILTVDTAAYFSQVTGEFGSIPWHVLVAVIVAGILMFGATKGIEKVNKVLMPSLSVLSAILAIRMAFLPGAEEGYKSFFTPGQSDLLKVDTWVMAMGQASFSLSIIGSGMIVYGTCLAKTEDIPKASARTTFFDTVAAMMTTLAIMSAVPTFDIESNAGPPLMFIILSEIFRQMPMGRLSAVIFSLSVVFVGITSLINMFEAVSEPWQSRLKLPRKAAVALYSGIALLVGIFLESEPKVGSWMDFIAIVVVPFGAVLEAVSIYYILGYKEIREEPEEGCEKSLGEFFGSLAEYVCVPLAVIVFILGTVYGGIGRLNGLHPQKPGGLICRQKT